MEKSFDVVIVGGSYAGLSAAMALGRSLRKVLVVDSGKPCNAQTPHSHNFLTQDGKSPAEIASVAKHQVKVYETVQLINNTVTKITKAETGFDVFLESGEQSRAKKIIFASGIKDQLPGISGFAECWGISAVHCPYCHGFEYRAKKTAILANGETALHYAMLVGNLTKELQIFTNGRSEFSDDVLQKFRRHNISVNEAAIASLQHKAGHLTHVILESGEKLAFDALYYRPPFKQQTSMPETLGVAITELGYLQVDASQKTSVDGVFACGDNSNMMRSVANAVSSGNIAGAVVNRELSMEQF